MNKISTVHQPVNKSADTDFAKFCGLLRIYELYKQIKYVHYPGVLFLIRDQFHTQ